MNKKPVLICVSLLALGLAGCASAPHHPPAPPAIPGYTFGYRVSGGHATLASNNTRTWVVLPAGDCLQQAEGDGKDIPFHRDGAYWKLNGVATHWKLYTSNGPISATAPDTVGVMLAAHQQAKAQRPVDVTRTHIVTVRFADGSSALTPKAVDTLKALAHRLDSAHSVQRVAVRGETTRGGSMTQNAQIGSARARVVAGWLSVHGVPHVNDLGWVAGGRGTDAMVAARYTVRKTPDKQSIATHPMVPPAVAKTAAAKTKAVAKTANKKAAKTAISKARISVPPMISAAHAVVFTTTAGRLLSKELRVFLGHHGWALYWNDPTDFVVGVPGRYTGRSIKAVLSQIRHDYHIPIRRWLGNHSVVVGNLENQ